MIKYNLICKNCDMSYDSWFASSKEYEKLKKYRIGFIKNVISKVFEEVDLFIAPVWPCIIPSINESDLGANDKAAYLVRRIGHNTRPINYLGLPAISVPIDFDENGLPLSIQLVGKPFSEDLLLRNARKQVRHVVSKLDHGVDSVFFLICWAPEFVIAILEVRFCVKIKNCMRNIKS